MTVIEERAMEAIITMNRKMKDSSGINWEQRRYEIAKAVMAADVTSGSGQYSEESARFAVVCADALIRELKK